MRRKRTVKPLDRAVERLYKAVANYVKTRGGTVVVAGGVQLQEWPNDGMYKFTIAVPCSGKKPKDLGK